MKSAPTGMGLLLLGRKRTFYSSCSCGIALAPVMTSPISSSKSQKIAVSQLAWDWVILMHFCQGGGKGTFNSVAAMCFGLKISEIHICLRNKFVLSPDSPSGAVSCDSGPAGFRPAPLGVHGRFSLLGCKAWRTAGFTWSWCQGRCAEGKNGEQGMDKVILIFDSQNSHV